jgi:transposase
MGRGRPPYPPEFRAEAVQLYRSSGKSLKTVAEEIGVSLEALRTWVKRAEIDEGTRPGLTTEEREELRRLHRENRTLRMERDLLKKVPMGGLAPATQVA